MGTNVPETTYPFEPDFVIPAGETLRYTLEVLGMTQVEPARCTGFTPQTINGIIKGKEPITPATALALERVLGTPASFWNNLERNYRMRLERIPRQRPTRGATAKIDVASTFRLQYTEGDPIR